MAEKSLKINAIFSFVKAFMNLAFPIITFPYASRILLPDGIGKVNFINSVVQYFIMFAELGIASYSIREASKIRKDDIAFTKFSKEIFTINIISTIFAYCLLFISIFASKLLFEYRILIILCSVKILFTTLGMDWMYAAKEEFKYITIRTIFFQLISLIYLFLFVKDSSDIIEYTIFGILSSTGSNICNFIYSRKFINWKYKVKLEFKKHLKPIFILFGTTLAISVYTILDSTMLGFLVGNESVGIYTAATKINKMLITLIASLNIILLPRLSFYAESNKDDYIKTLKKSYNYIIMISLPLFVGLCVLSEPLTYVFCGKSFENAIIPMQLMSPIILIISLGSFFSQQIFIPNRKDKYAFYPVVVGSIVNVVINFLLIPKYKAIGAAIATLFAEATVTTIKFFLGKKILINTNFFYEKIYHYILATLIMGISLFFINQTLSPTIISLIVELFIGIIIYFTILIIFRNNYIIELFNDINKKLRKKDGH